MLFPWQEKQWRQLQLAVERQKLPHAVLLSGAEGMGIEQFASEFARRLLCETPLQSGSACGRCRSCTLFGAGNHPDIRIINPEERGRQIRVDVIRNLIDYFHLSSHYGRHKIAIIAPAEEMNRSSANGLLKTLEEPPDSSLLMLISHRPAKLPVTIRSRCQKITFGAISRQSALDWLNEQISDSERAAALLDLAGNAPLKALALDETDILDQQREVLADLLELRSRNAPPVKIAEKWQKFDVVEVLTWLLRLFGAMAAMRCAGRDGDGGASSIHKSLQRLADGLDLPRIISCYDLALKNYQLLTGEINLNRQNLLEEIIVHWQFLPSHDRNRA